MNHPRTDTEHSSYFRILALIETAKCATVKLKDPHDIKTIKIA